MGDFRNRHRARLGLPPVVTAPPAPVSTALDVRCVPYTPGLLDGDGPLVVVPHGTHADPLHGTLLGAWVATGPDVAAYVAPPVLLDLLARPRPVWTYSSKDLYKWCTPSAVPRVTGDVLLAAYLLMPTVWDDEAKAIDDAQERYTLARLLEHYCSVRYNVRTVCTGDVSADDGAQTASALYRLVPILHERLTDDRLWYLYQEAELPLAQALARMEGTGITLDTAYLQTLSHEYHAEADRLAEAIYAQAGSRCNLRSPLQLRKVLYTDLRIPTGKKTAKGVLSTQSRHLKKYKDKYPVLKDLLRWRQLDKLCNTYVDKMPVLLHPGTGRLHCQFNQAVTCTGRLSSSGPNLQNIPARSAEGPRVRNAFTCAPGRILIAADYSQIELRVLAHIAQDPVMLRCFTEGEDLHIEAAMRVYGVDADHVTPDMRRVAKIVNFSIPYGTSEHGLAEQTELPVEEAADIRETYLNRFPRVKQYMLDTEQFVYQHGYVETLYGRRRYVPDAQSTNTHRQAAAVRAAVNMPIQGTAADIMKLALVRIAEALVQADLPDADLLLQVHDEVVLECWEADADPLMSLVRDCMVGAATLAVPLDVSVNAGKTWGVLK